MRENYIERLQLLIGGIPGYVWVGFGVCTALLVAAFMLYGKRHHRPVGRPLSMALLLEFAFWVLCFTVLCRTWHHEHPSVRPLAPFWSYRAIMGGNFGALLEVVLNVVLFMPIGALYRCAVRYPKWWILLVLAAVFSMSIELMQYILLCGNTELDDVIHNSLGALIGFGLAVCCQRVFLDSGQK